VIVTCERGEMRASADGLFIYDANGKREVALPKSAAMPGRSEVLDDMIARCRELDLRAVGPEQKLVTDFTVLLTAKTMHALFGPSRRRWIAL